MAANMSLHDLAVDVSSDLRQLATGLAHAGANPTAVQQLGMMADRIDQVVKALASGPVGNQPTNEPAEPGAAAAPPAHAGPPASAGPPPAAPQPGPANPTTIGHAVVAVHQAMQQAAKQRAAQ